MIEFEDVRIAYKDKPVLDGVSLTIHDREFFVLIGSSGCGKTTLLKSINKLLPLRGGSLSIDGIPVEQIKVQDLPKKVGYVVQSGGLFPHLTVEENIALTMQIARFSKEAIRDRVDKMLKMVNLDPEIYRGQYPSQLSGGQQQRVGIARAFAANPPIVLMDEPFSALDPMTRAELQNEIHDLQTKAQKTVVFVTHDMDEAIKLADRICIMEEGKITQFDTPENILKNPANDFVRNFIGPKRIWTSPEYIKTRDIMITDPVCCHPKMPIFKCIETMGRKKVDTLMLTDQKGRLFGVLFAESLIGVHDIKKPAEDFMYREFTSVGPDSSIVDLLTLFDEHHLSTLPVVNSQGIIEGLITRSTLINTLSRQFIADAGKEES